MNGKRLINAVYKIAVFSFLLVIAGCKENVGLGESVDTVNPEVSINYPPSGAVIMDSFYIGGECSDDKGVSKISVELKKIGSTSETIGFYPAEIYEKGKKWKILMNQPSSSEDSYNGWTIQDGSYEVNVVAWDEAGRTSGAASRNFDIDNTAPVLVVSNPGVSVKSGRDYSSYGSSFSLEGKVADKHKINKIEVSVFDSEGNAKAGTDVNPFTETNLDSGAVSLLFARNGTTGTLADNYAALYDLSDGHFGTTEKYTCSVTLSDNAAIYKDPDSLTYIAEGNSTSTVYLNDDLNEKLLSSRNGLGLAVSALYDVLSLTSEKSYTNGENTKTAEEIFKILEECKIVTKAEDSSVEARQSAAENRLGFTLNPEANPTYSVAGYLLKDKNTASSGNTISVSASYGLDQNYLDPKTFKVWIKEYDSLPESSILEEDIAAVEKFAYGISKTSAPADWIRLFDNEEYNSNSQANYTLSVTLDAEKINIQLDKYYVVVLTGKDQEGLEFAQKEIYGFIGTVSGQPPKLEISSPVNLSFVKGSEKSNLEFIGKVENSGSISLSKLTAVLKVEDENKSSDSTVYESSPVTIQYNSVLKQWESSSCLNVSSSGEKGAGKWSFVPSLCADYDKFKAEEQSEKSYLYTLSVTAVAASGHTATAEVSVHIDTINPAVEITGITPIVDGKDYKGENDSNLYVNGKISFNGNITETNNIDKGVSYKFLDKNGDVIKTSGGALLEGVFDSRIYKFSKEIDTTEIADGTEFEIVVEAKDVVGNKGSYSSKDYTGGKFYIVDQNSDKPVISLKNADMSVKKEQDVLVNAFDCAYAEASINGSVIDDDGIQSVSVKIYDANENLIGGSQSFISKNNSTTFDFKFTIPKNEGLYLVQITAQDKNFKDSETTPYSEQIADKFLILVDNGAPKFSKVELPDFINSGNLEFTVKVEEKCLDSFDIQLKKDDKEVNAEDFTSKSEDGKSITVTIPADSSHKNDGTWTFTATAYDKLEKSNTTLFGPVVIDTTLPELEFTEEPSKEKEFVDKSTSQTYKGSVTESNSGISDVLYRLKGFVNGEEKLTEWETAAVKGGKNSAGNIVDDITFKVSVDLEQFDDNSNVTVFFKAIDNAGNETSEVSKSLKLDATKPSVTFASWDDSNPYTKETQFELSGTVTEKNLSSLELFVVKDDGESKSVKTWTADKIPSLSTGNAEDWLFTYNANEDGKYYFVLTAEDKAGLKDSVTSKTVYVDTEGPTVTVDPIENNQIFNTTAYTFTGSWSDSLSGTDKLYYRIDEGETVTSSVNYAGKWSIEIPLTEGIHNFTFWGTDKNGNQSETKATGNVKVDFAKPVVSLKYKVGSGEETSSSPSYIADGVVLTVSGTVEESNGVREVIVKAKKGDTEVASGNSGYSVVTNLEENTFTVTLTGGSESSGEWSFDVEAEDNAGRKSSVSNVKTSVDMTPPQWLTSWGTNGENKFKVDNKEYDIGNWYSGAALSFNGAFLEAGSGVDQIYYLVIPAGDNSSDATLSESNYTGTITVTGDSNNYWVFNSAISGFKASSSANIVKFMAKDKAGNTSAIQTVTIMRDQIAPAINTDGSTILTNGVLDIKLSGSVSDDASGTASLEITINGINDFNAVAHIEDGGNWTSSLPASTLENLETGTTYEVWGKATDNAGNISESRIAKLNVDKTPPVVKFSDSVKNQAVQGINGENNIIGTVEESNVPESLEFFYTLEDPSTALTPEDSNGTPAGWTKIGNTVTSSQQIYNWTVSDFDFTVKSEVLTKTDGTAKIYILPVAVDEAGNCNAYTKNNSGEISWNLKPGEVGSETAQWLAFNVDASLDRPLITFSDLTDNSNAKNASSLIIKNSDGGIITGLAEDDDGIEIIAISSDEISTEKGKTFADLFEKENENSGTFIGKKAHSYTVSSGEVEGYDKFIYKNGSFEFHPANPLDGKKTIYIYVKDSAGGEFYSTYSANTGYTVQKNPRIKIKTGNVLDNTKKIEYTSDCTSPVVSSIKIATGDSENAESLSQYSWESGRKIGGTKEKFVKFQVEASDSNGIKTVSLKLKQGSREETLALSGSETTDSSTATFTSTESFDLSSAFTTGEITVTATATDQTGMSGNSVILPYADFEVEESGFSVISPAATESEGKLVSDDILTSSLTISGSATESSGCGIETVQWMVQPKVNGNVVTVDQIKFSPSTYESKWSTGKSSATYTQWKFIFDGDTDSVTTETSGGTEISHYPKFEKITSNTTYYNITTENGICRIPLFFKVTDKLGNVAYIDSYVLRYNPDADRPNAKILYPENGKDVGDVIRVNGSAEDNVSVSKVYIQISTVKGESGIVWNENDEKLVKGRTSAGEDSSYLKTVTLAQSGYDAEKFPEGMSTGWWGIEASGTISWSYSINRYGEFNSELVDGTDNGTKVYLRACSIDNLGKASVWSDVVEFTVFSGVPKVEFNTIAQFSDDSLSTVSAQNTNYEAGSYLTNANGQWYLVVNASHESGISGTSVSCSTQGTPMTKQTSVTAITGNGDGKYSSYYAEEVAVSETVKNYKLYIPVDTRYEGDVTYTVTATDNTEGKKNNTQSYTYKIDNIAPEIGELTSGNTRNPANIAVKGNKLVNSDGGSASIKSVVKEDISGFTMMAYYFVRNGKIYNPFPGTDGSKFIKQKQTGVDVSGLTSKSVGGTNLYGATVTGPVVENATEEGAVVENKSCVGNDATGVYFTASASVTDSNIRSGGLILIEGIYYQISKIDGSKIYVKGLSENSKAKEAFCPYALVIQYNAEAGDTTESITSGSYSEGYTVNEKDGDGIVETVNKVGTDYTLETNIMSDSIPDGEIEIVCIAFDKAGNASSSSTKTMISNNLPRVSKVWLATDLNQDGYFKKDEFVWYSENNGVEVSNYSYSCLDSSGNGQEIVTLTTKDSRGNQFTVKDKLALTMELLTGGTGNSYEALSYIAKFGKEAAEAPATGEIVTGSLTDTVTGVENTVSQKGILFDSGTFTSYEDTTPYLQLTLWDKVNIPADKNGEFIATVDEKDANGIITSYGNQYTVLNIPVAVDIKDDVAPKGTITPFFWKKAGSSEGKVNDGSNSVYYSVTGESPNCSYTPFGHIELGEKPEVSGTVVLTGTVSDDQLMKTVTVEFTLGLGSEAKATTISATYTASDKTWTPDSKEVTKDGYQLIMSNDKLTQAGHSADWTLYLDTAKLGNAETKTVTVTVTQAKPASDTNNNYSTPGSTQTTVKAETGYYAMKVVPYITEIARSGTTNRSRFGRYAVKEGETVTVSGFNFGTSGTVQVGNNDSTGYTCTKDSSAKDGATSFTMTVPVKSGGVVVTTIGEISSTSGGVVVTTIGKISSTNNTNDNDGHGKAPEGTSNSHRLNYYNREAEADNNLSTDYTDDRYLSVWALGNYFKGTDGGVELQKPVMTADKSGNLYASWVSQSSSNVIVSYGVSANKTPVFRCYDQPSNYSAISYDTKSDNSGGLNIGFIGEHQGNGGTFSNNAMSSAHTVGGAAAIRIAKDKIGTDYGTSPLVVQVDNNPKFQMDGDNYTAFYNLANYDMNRRLGSFENPKSAIYKTYLHNIWYDNVNESLKYSVTNTANVSKFDNNPGGISGWVLLDGGYTGQDRLHEFTNEAGKKANTLVGDGNVKHHLVTGTNKGAKYSTEIFLSSGQRTTDRYGMTVADDKKSITITTNETDVQPKTGDTITLLNNTQGTPYIATRTVTVEGNKVSWDKAVDFEIHSATIHCGNMNVVGGTTTTTTTGPTGTTITTTGPTGTTTTTTTTTAATITTTTKFSKAEDQSSSAGLSADIDVTSDGKPVVAYYDATNSKLKVAYATSEEPKLASAWKRVDTGLSCSGEVSMRVDSKNGIHIMFMDTSGQLCYAYAASTEDLKTKIENKTMKAEVIDTNGSLSYGSISVKEVEKVIENSSVVVVIPTVTYLNRANTDDCIKYAYRRAEDGKWDYQIVPSLGEGHHAVAENKISLESRNTDWTEDKKTSVLQNDGTTKVGTAYPATVDSVIAFKSKRFETAYLKSE